MKEQHDSPRKRQRDRSGDTARRTRGHSDTEQDKVWKDRRRQGKTRRENQMMIRYVDRDTSTERQTVHPEQEKAVRREPYNQVEAGRA